MGTLELQVGDGEVFAHFQPEDAGPSNGGYLGRVFSGGHFMGVGFEELRALGTGRHQVSVDERAPSERGQEPEYESDWDRLFAQFQYRLFTYAVGACVAHEVLSAAREVIRQESQQQRHAEPPAAPDRAGK